MARSRITGVLNLLPFLPLASRGPAYGRLLLELAMDPRVPTSRKALLGLAAAYLVSPVDLIPERVPLLGAVDDLAVVVLAVDLFLEGIPASLVNEKLEALGVPRQELDSDLARVRRVVPKPIRAAASRIPDALDGLAAAAQRSGLDRRLRAAVAARLSAPATEESPA
jgi:uncharacterized membrane protein YkvA (DUF1232 family)